MKAILTVLGLLVLASSLSSCVTLAGVVGAATTIVSPVARSVDGARGERVHLAGLRVDDFGLGVYAGRIPSETMTPAERRRLEELEKWAHELEIARAIETAPPK